MNKFLIFVFLFFTGSIFGWGLETVFRRFTRANTSRKWINPGFLVGPYLPLYGFGLCALYLLAETETRLPFSSAVLSKIAVVLLMGISMTALELIAGLIFVKKMKVKLWDYSDKPFNFEGIICLEFSIYWILLAAVYYLLIHPHILSALEWFASNLAFSFVLGVFFGVIAIDTAYSFNIAAKVRRLAVENDVLVRYEELKSNIRKYTEEHKGKYRFLFAFHTKIPLNEHLTRYIELHKAFRRKKK